MKKIILAIAALALIASPALAVDWNFYGSARTVTWYTSSDLGDGTTLAGGNDNDDVAFLWGSDGHDNARFGARVKAENISGRVEIQLRADDGGDPSSVITTESRLIYGEWDFGAGKLLVGKAYTPVAQFISGQAFDEDIGLLTVGASYGQRINGLQLSFGGLTVAVLEPNVNNVSALTVGDTDTMLPKLEAKYGMSFDMFNFTVMGGYQHYEIEDGQAGAPVGFVTDDIDVDSYIIGGNAGVNFGPAYVKGAISYGENIANAAWDIAGLYTAGAAAALNAAGDDTDDVTTLQFAGVVGFKFTDQVTFETGIGWREDDYDAPGLDEDDVLSWYLQGVISLAPGMWVIPEIGYQDYGDDNTGADEGDKIYAGAKWQIDF
jgi:hypothetical protein